MLHEFPLTVLHVLSQWHRDGGCSPIRWFIQTSRLQVVHLCYRRRHDSHTSQGAGQNGGNHAGTNHYLCLHSYIIIQPLNHFLKWCQCNACVLVFVPQGSKGLSLFYAEVSRDKDGRLRGIEVQRLKDKLGTRQMPTAELLLDGLPAHRVSSPSPFITVMISSGVLGRVTVKPHWMR